MFKKTKGKLLLLLLVLTGLAGKNHTETLTARERRNLISEMKHSRAAFLQSIEGLNPRQLDFRPGPQTASIRECIYQMVAVQCALWQQTKTILQQHNELPPYCRMKDAFLPELLRGTRTPLDLVRCKKIQFPTIRKAVQQYNSQVALWIRYARTGTDNARMHSMSTTLGVFDGYQLMLLAPECAGYFTRQIQQIRSDPRFPAS